MYDLVIKNGLVVGHGKVDLAINKGMIEAIGKDIDGKEIIDASGLIVSPGFIDMHTHSDISFIENSSNDSKLSQGVTTELVGLCGYSFYPYSEKGMKLQEKNMEITKYDSRSMKTFIESHDKDKSLNWASLIGHRNLRLSVVGDEDVKASPSQIDEMKDLLDRELLSGAFGLSLGLAYSPGMFADTEELIELAKVANIHGKIVSAHIRNENIHVFEAVSELIEIGEKSGAHVHISHLKLGYGSWHKVKEMFSMIDAAKARGVKITFEQYPYIASATGLSAVLPNWVHDGGVEGMIRCFKNERQKVIDGIMSDNSFKMGLDRVVVVTTKGLFSKGDGKSVREISKMLGLSEAETVIYLLENLECDVPTIRFTMDKEDVFEIARRRDVAVISDGSAYTLDPDNIDGMPHPRSFGTFPRYLKLNRTYGWMSLEDAIYKMTELPAKLMGLEKRGIISEGCFADITIFDENEISDTATYENAISQPIGIKYVIVNGKVAFKEGRATVERAGEMLLSL